MKKQNPVEHITAGREDLMRFYLALVEGDAWTTIHNMYEACMTRGLLIEHVRPFLEDFYEDL